MVMPLPQGEFAFDEVNVVVAVAVGLPGGGWLIFKDQLDELHVLFYVQRAIFAIGCDDGGEALCLAKFFCW